MPYKDPRDPRIKEVNARYYRKNREEQAKRVKARKALVREWFDELKTAPCMDCGQTFPPYVMDYDHRDRSQKAANVSTLLFHASIERVLEEIAKCDLVCANCHRIRTHAPDAEVAEAPGS